VNYVRLSTAITGNERNWTFIGVPKWKQDHTGHIYPPVWSYPNFDPDPSLVPEGYAHELARLDFALLTYQPLADTDVSVDYKCPYGSVLHGGIVFRAMDSSRFYVVDIEDMGRKGNAYELTLWLQDATGYWKQLARGIAPHSVAHDKIVQRGCRTREEWNHSSPDWVTVRVQASGSFMRVSMDGRIVFETRDRTYPVGCAGLLGRGAVFFRNLTIEGIPAELPAPWTTHKGELPRFFYPGGEQPEGFNAYPIACRAGKATLAAWSHAPRLTNPSAPTFLVLTRSEDEGRSWSAPQRMFGRDGHNCYPSSIFSHRDGALSCLVSIAPVGGGEEGEPLPLVLRSADGGMNWSEVGEFTCGGRPLRARSEGGAPVSLYSPMMRLSDGSVVMCGYEYGTVPGGGVGSNAERLDRSLLFRSEDDGHTWNEPVYFDETNFDHNECMLAETEPGRLVAFMRTLSAPHMWTSTSDDGGRTWTPLVQSSVSAECPFLLRHSSGALVMGSRGGPGTCVTLSFDGGRTWTDTVCMSPSSAMMGMVEMADGRVLNVMHEGYRSPGYIRGQFFRVTPGGPVAAP